MLNQTKSRLIFSTLALITVSVFTLSSHKIAAASPVYSNAELIDNGIFLNTGSMNQSQIQSFLASRQSFLANYSVPETVSYYPNYNQTVPASQVIYDASQVYGINPQVILATLQKEQSLVTDPTPIQSQLDFAMGYGCADSTGCGSYSGFFNQVDNGAWQLKFDYERASGNETWWNPNITYPCGKPSVAPPYTSLSPNNSYYYYPGLMPGNNVTFYDEYGNGYTTFTVDNAATAALYCYTPHAYPGSSQQYYSGSYNFVQSFDEWWGASVVPDYSWQPDGQAVFSDSTMTTSLGWGATLTTNESAYAVVQALNIGNEIWTNTGPNPVNLGTDVPTDRASPFCTSGWYEPCGRPAQLLQSSVPPGQVGTFEFPITAPGTAGTYDEHFNLVADGLTWFNDPGQFFTFIVIPQQFTWQPDGQVVYTDSTMNTSLGWGATLTTNESAYAVVQALNTGNYTWTQTGLTAVELGTDDNRDRSSPFCTSHWYGCNRPALLEESSVAPGQVGTFEFPITAPGTAGTYHEHFNLVGNSWFADPGQTFTFVVIPQQFTWQPAGQSIYTDSSMTTSLGWGATLTPGETAYAVVQALNTSNYAWTNTGPNPVNLGTDDPIDRSSPFCTSGWYEPCGRPAQLLQSSVPPGQVGTFEFPITAPGTAGTYDEHFNLVADGLTWFNDPGQFFILVVN